MVKVPYKKIVFLTFANDGEKAAHKIADALRKPTTDRPPFGVLILEENAEAFYGNVEEKINSVFNDVDYVMPIITPGYLNTVRPEENPLLNAHIESSLDSNYAFYIYDLMRKYYTRNRCINDKFRCIIPDDFANNNFRKSTLYNKVFRFEPTLSIWGYESDIECIAQKMAKN